MNRLFIRLIRFTHVTTEFTIEPPVPKRGWSSPPIANRKTETHETECLGDAAFEGLGIGPRRSGPLRCGLPRNAVDESGSRQTSAPVFTNDN